MFVTVFYKRFRKVCPQCNTIVHAMEWNKSMHLRKVCPQCSTVVHVKRSVCDCGHAFASKDRKARCTAVGESENTIKLLGRHPVFDNTNIEQLLH